MRQIIIHYVWLSLALAFVAFMVSYWAYPLVLRMARVWKFYDKPDARKLQQKPVPVLGGLAVFAGIFVCTLIVTTLIFDWKPLIMLGGMIVLMCVGMIDDKRGLNAILRFVIEITVVVGLIFFSGNLIDQFGGVLGLFYLPGYVACPLSVIAGVGIINSINMIDGVDGYSSGYICMACLLFGILFIGSRIYGLGFTCLITAGAVLPFFLHNVFGQKTKMFIGDGGTLMLGTLMTSLVFSVLRKESMCLSLANEHNVGLVAVCLAILAIPVFDTLRVMIGRISKGHSPFNADKTHLHHLFVDMGFSHVVTTFTILSLDILIVIGWLVAWLIGVGPTWQLLVVVLLGFLATFVLYTFMRWHQRHQTTLWVKMCHFCKKTDMRHTAFWQWMQKFVDGDLFSDGYIH